VLLKKLQAELKRGTEIKVGGITFNASGMQKGRKQVAWSDIASYAPETSAVALRTGAGKTITFRYNQEKDQNFHVLHDLVTAWMYNRNRIP
jgi:hypothetical protein